MSRAQWVAVGITLLISATDGHDILAAALPAPSVLAHWHLTHETLGKILAINLIGLAIGSLFISPLADRIGRRLTILGSLLLVTASMFLSAAADAPFMLGLSRLIAGIGIGGMVGATLSLATEYANLRNRPLTAAVISVGLPLGGLLGAATAAVLLKDYSWRAIFMSGGVLTLAITGLSAVLLPESVDYLMGRGGGRSLFTLTACCSASANPLSASCPWRPPALSRAPQRRARAASSAGGCGRRRWRWRCSTSRR